VARLIHRAVLSIVEPSKRPSTGLPAHLSLAAMNESGHFRDAGAETKPTFGTRPNTRQAIYRLSTVLEPSGSVHRGSSPCVSKGSFVKNLVSTVLRLIRSRPANFQIQTLLDLVRERPASIGVSRFYAGGRRGKPFIRVLIRRSGYST
jgi:hypothetical protein